MQLPCDPRHPLALRTVPDAPDAGGGAPPAGDPLATAALLASAEQTLRDISHALAHDLRTSLRHISSYAQLIEDAAQSDAPEPLSRLSHKVLESTRQLQRLLDSLAQLARLQPAGLQREEVDTTSLLRQLIRELDEGPAGKGSRVACVLAPDLPVVSGDPHWLRTVWQALLDNAWRHARGHAQPRVEVWSESVPGGQAFFVRDNGAGFAPDRAGELFGLFRHDRSTQLPGTGVGLALVRRVVECHGGRVWASARPGEGACFGFSLPAAGR